MDHELQIVFADDDVLVVNKPNGLATQAPPGIDSLEWRVRRFFKRQTSQAGKVYLGVPHRLDRPASGVIVFAKNKPAARHLAKEFQRREVHKIYWTLVSGDVVPDQGTWSDLMRKLPDEARSEIASTEHPDAQLASLRYRVVQRAPAASWLEIVLETGRSHQIRLQSSARGYPILGDQLYGSTVDFGPHTADRRLRHIALHARMLQFKLPGDGNSITVTAIPPETWSGLGWEIPSD